jgi:hypothetical protein
LGDKLDKFNKLEEKLGLQVGRQVGQVELVGREVGRQVGGQVGGQVKGQAQDGSGAITPEMHYTINARTKALETAALAYAITTWGLV